MIKNLLLTLFICLPTAAAFIFGVQYLTPIDLVEENDCNTEKISKHVKKYPQITTIIETEKQIIVKPNSNLKNVIVVYSGNKSPIAVKEEEFVSRTGISITTITPNDFDKFITQY